MSNPEDNSFFVGVSNPVDVRRNVLECSREMIQNLQSYERISQIREIKVKRIKQLKTVMKELDMLFGKLKTQLPKTHMRAETPEKKSKVHTHARTIKQADAIQKLDSELRDIEHEIARLS